MNAIYKFGLYKTGAFAQKKNFATTQGYPTVEIEVEVRHLHTHLSTKGI
ncbi:hypothetical protein CASFOL_026997 [Castilleja foliolosa]|uniref:Uncharacterized protein n=1 Tax=Castilleja foliolosa TaxID=1961234 RepID=A0ABD3CIM1_9LAMI